MKERMGRVGSHLWGLTIESVDEVDDDCEDDDRASRHPPFCKRDGARYRAETIVAQ